MARFPLALSAHPSAWSAPAVSGRREASAPTKACQFCGQPTAGWQESFHLNDNHDDQTPDNLAVSCPLCHLSQHLHRPEIDSEAALIWLPEMAQGAINVLVRHLHLACAAAGLTPAYEGLLRIAPPTSPAYRAYQTLHERSSAAALRLGTTSPRHLGSALLELEPADYARRTALLSGIRLLPLGRIFHGGRDVYRDMLHDWAACPQAA
jgi:intracellular multiplication protein IcmJ